MHGAPSRRQLLGIAGLGVAGGVTAGVAGCTKDSPPPVDRAAAAPPVTATGVHQAGIVEPAPAQDHLLTLVLDLRGEPRSVLAGLGRSILALTAGRDRRLAGLTPGDLTITVGIGPRLVQRVDPTLPGSTPLPRFPRERLTGGNGDLMVQLCASDPLVLPGAAAALSASAGAALTEQWRQTGFRGGNVEIGSKGLAPRNLLGFVDGIVVPRRAEEYQRGVWLPPGTPAGGGTIAVVRRMEIDLERFLAAGVEQQERIVGRRRASAAPLTGGDAATDPDLGAKTPTGAYRIPADAHVRRANPVQTGVPKMLRRSYSFADTAAGLFFVSFQNALHTFVATMNRMSTSDALLDFTTTTRAGTFLVLPGFDGSRPLGASLFG